MKANHKPDYIKIYTDILNINYPHKKEVCKDILKKVELTAIDVIKINQLIFGDSKKPEKSNGKHRSYEDSDILQILTYQKNHQLNNIELAHVFKLSRNTVTKWKKKFIV